MMIFLYYSGCCEIFFLFSLSFKYFRIWEIYEYLCLAILMEIYLLCDSAVFGVKMTYRGKR